MRIRSKESGEVEAVDRVVQFPRQWPGRYDYPLLPMAYWAQDHADGTFTLYAAARWEPC